MISLSVSKKTGKKVTLSDAQLKALGISTPPELLGCGEMACAYAIGPDRVVKFTKDVRDAMASFLLANTPELGEGWVIPIESVYRLRSPAGYFVITAARAEPLPEDAEEAINWVYDYASDFDSTAQRILTANGWQDFVNSADELLTEHDDPENDLRRTALEVINNAVLGFRRLGLDWIDFHGGNFGVYQGHVVVIDPGMSFPAEMPPVDTLDRFGVARL